MNAGGANRFSLNFEIKSVVDDWVFGTFFVVINGLCVGNPSDHSVDMKGCLRWWRDFATNPRDRYEPVLYEDKKEKVFSLLAAAVLVNEDPEGVVSEIHEDCFYRFHISHIGMSSFDGVTMLFLKNEKGSERLVWKGVDGELHDAYFPDGELERIFSDGVVYLEKAIEENS